MIIALLILVLQSAPAVPAPGPTLADVARKERARQKTATSEATFSNETLGIPEKPSAPPETKPAAEPAKPGGPATAAAPDVRDEAWWRNAFSKARDDVKRDDDRIKVLQLELNQLNMDLLTRSDIYNREGVLGPQITAKKADLAKAEMDAAQARAKVTQLEDDLRRAGAPAGWAR